MGVLILIGGCVVAALVALGAMSVFKFLDEKQKPDSENKE